MYLIHYHTFKIYSLRFIYHFHSYIYINMLYAIIRVFFFYVSMLIPRHYFNNIQYTMWPFFLSMWLFFFIFFFILYINRYFFITEELLLFSLSMVIFFVYKWFSDIIVESSMLGRYNRKIRSSIVFGFILFLVSEIMLFSGFFWSYFDRIFHISFSTYNMSNLNGFELLSWYKRPLWATLCLVTSGYIYNHAYYMLKIGCLIEFGLGYAGALWFAYLFLFIQYQEYIELSFTISDSIYCSLFFLLTGFHGMHVLIGMNFMIFASNPIAEKGECSTSRALGFGLSLIYWHFVDIIWIFLFFFIYVLNNWDFIYLIYDSNYLYYGL